jgi:peptide deformylase
MIRPIVKMGNPILFAKSQEINDFKTIGLSAIVNDMIDTMRHLQGVGIAAPQIGYPFRIIAFGFEQNDRYPNEKPIPLTVLVNPKLTITNKQLESASEGCLSIPGLRAKVPRYKALDYEGMDLTGKMIKNKAIGFLARILQHEMDHIDGRLFPSRIDDFNTFGFES